MPLRTILATALVLALITGTAMADCKSDLNSAKSLLDKFRSNAIANGNASSSTGGAQAKANEIKAYLDRMVSGNCQAEIRDFQGYVLSQQNIFPDPRSNPDAYKGK